MWRRRRAVAVVVLLPAMLACGGRSGEQTSAPFTRPTTTAPPPSAPSTVTTTSSPPDAPEAPEIPEAPTAVEIPLRLEQLVSDEATAGFGDVVIATLTDPRGWSRAGFVFTFGDDAPYTIVLAEGPEVDARCAPYDTGGRFSCQLGPMVALNAHRWREATPEWTGDLDSYRQMLVNHEVGHLLGQHHPTGGCTTPGAPAPVMVQQSTNLDGCLPNPWPLEWEIRCAAARLEPLAPPHEDDARPVCGPERPHTDHG